MYQNWKLSNWKLPDRESVIIIGESQIVKIFEFECVRMGECQNWKMLEFESVRIAKCKNLKLLEFG